MRMPSLSRLILLTLLLCAIPPAAAPAAGAGRITGYRAIFHPCRDAAGALQFAIRRYEIAGEPNVILVDPQTFVTTTVKLASLKSWSMPVGAELVTATPFYRALARATDPPYRLQNHGAVRAEQPVAGVFLTVDMCPSVRPFEREMFEAVAGMSRGTGPVPVAIAITGRWLERHGEEFAWLVEQVRQGRLDITWVNHSFSHPYHSGEPLERNFLLTPGTELEREVLQVEVMLLERGVAPSPFFRFPGLVSDGRLVQQLRGLSLIPLGSEAWLAKGEQPRSGSFILVHGNGNEPPGIRKLLPLLRGAEPPRFLPLPRAFGGSGP